jgi:hypothetical protein
LKKHNNSGKKSEPTSKPTKSPGPVLRDTKEVLAELVGKLKETLDFKKVAATSAGEKHQSGELRLWLPKTRFELKMQRFRAFVRSWWYHDELSFCCPFRFGHLQFSNPCRAAGGDPRASSSTRGFPEECTAAFAPPAVRPAFVGLAVTMVARLAPESTLGFSLVVSSILLYMGFVFLELALAGKMERTDCVFSGIWATLCAIATAAAWLLMRRSTQP